MNKTQAQKYFVEGVQERVVNFGFSVIKGKFFERVNSEEGILVKIIPDFGRNYGEIIFDVYVEIYIDEYSVKLNEFNREFYPNDKVEDSDLITMEVNRILKKEIDFHGFIDIYVEYFNDNFNIIENFISNHMLSNQDLLTYFKKNKLVGGVNRSLAIFVLMHKVRGSEAACKWLKSGEPYTASPYQEKQLSFLLSKCGQ